MKRIRLLAVLAIAMVAGLLVTGCKSPMDLTPETRAASHWVGSTPEVFTIWASPHTNVGNVSVWNTPDTLYITYQTTGRWWLEQTDTHVALKLRDIPQRNHVPQPGRFEFQNDWHPRVQTCTLAIEKRDGWDVGVNLYIATHSVVVYVDNRGRVTQREEAWAGPYFFADGSVLCYGPRYIKYTVKDVYKDVTLPLPVNTCTMRVYTDITRKAHFKVRFSGIVGTGYDVQNYPDTTYLGWCAEHAVEIGTTGDMGDFPYEVHLWSSQDPALPIVWHGIQNDRWDNVNYLLNHKLTGATITEIQIAIWWLLTPNDASLLPDHPLVGNSKTMHDEALANGDGWHPSHGQLLAVVAVPTNLDIQTVFIEVDP